MRASTMKNYRITNDRINKANEFCGITTHIVIGDSE